MTDPKTVLFGVHVPKCAGTTLLERVKSAIPEHQIYQNTSIGRNFLEGKLEFTHLFEPRVLRFLFGHYLHQEMLKRLEGPVFLFTGLRHPVERVASEIRYTANLRRKQDLPPLDPATILQGVRNPICWFFIARFPHFAGEDGTPAQRAFRVLQHFDLCYFTETFERDAPAVFARLGISPPARSHNIGFSDAPVSMDMSLARLEGDLELYERAQEHFAGGADHRVSSEARAALDAFRRQAPAPELLRSFLYGECLAEYRNWSLLDAVIASRRALARELEAEIDFYEAKRQAAAA